MHGRLLAGVLGHTVEQKYGDADFHFARMTIDLFRMPPLAPVSIETRVVREGNRIKVAEGSLTQCPVSPRDALREPVRLGAHGIVFVHNHPSSGDPSPSVDDAELTDRLRAASEVVGILARDHVIVAANGYYSFVEAGRWR